MKNIIHLKDYDDIYKPIKEQDVFLKAYSTQSRMMGVIGLRVHYEKVVLFFHLDFEEYGFDRFEVCSSEDTSQIHIYTEEMMGGLGAPLTEITLEEASALVYQAVTVGETYLYDLPLAFFDYEDFLIEEIQPLTIESYQKITAPMTTVYEKINYFLMRTASFDTDYRDLMLSEKPFDFLMADEPTMLLKNTIEKTNDGYLCHAVMDHNNAYKLQVIEFVVHEKIASVTLKSEMVMSPREAAFQLNRKEYICVGYMDHLDSYKRQFIRKHPSAMKHLYEGGDLYTLFQAHNNHVKKDVYYLNEDVKGIVYITDNHQVVIACYSKEDYKDLKEKIFTEYPTLNMLIELEAEAPILNQFVTSGQKDFIKFIGE